jgi:hypothetical protein
MYIGWLPPMQVFKNEEHSMEHSEFFFSGAKLHSKEPVEHSVEHKKHSLEEHSTEESVEHSVEHKEHFLEEHSTEEPVEHSDIDAVKEELHRLNSNDTSDGDEHSEGYMSQYSSLFDESPKVNSVSKKFSSLGD